MLCWRDGDSAGTVVDRAGEAVAFYQAALGTTVLHQVGEGDDIVAQLAVDGAASLGGGGRPRREYRFSPAGIGGATVRPI